MLTQFLGPVSVNAVSLNSSFSKNHIKGGPPLTVFEKKNSRIYFFWSKYMILHYFLAIKAEKNEQKHRAGIEKFDKAELRKSQTVVKNPLPTKEDIEAEKQVN